MPSRCPLLAAATAFAGGLVVASHAAGTLSSLEWLAAAAGLTVLPFLTPPRPGFALASLLAAFGLAGVAAGSSPGLASPDAALATALEAGRPIQIVGRLREAPERRDRMWRLRLDAEELDGRPARAVGLRLSLPGGASTDGGQVARLLPGDRLRVSASLRRPRSFQNPGAFDYTSYLRRRGVEAVGWVKSPILVERLERGPPRPGRTLAATRRALLAALDDTMREGQASGLVAALLWGDRTGVRAAQRDTLVRAGTFHLLAISGMHVGLLAWALLRGGLAGGLRPVIIRMVVILFLPLYAALTGAHPPVVRAAWMAAAIVSARLLSRSPAPANALGIAALATLAVHPGAIHDSGLRLSFGAAGAILALAPGIARCLPGPRFLRGPLAASLSAFLGVGPLLAIDFHRIAPVGVAVSLVAVPLLATALVSGLAATLLECAVSGAGRLPGWIAAAAAGAILRLSEVASRVPGGNWATAGPSGGTVVAYYGLLGVSRLPLRRALRRPVRGLFVMAMAAVLAGRPGTGPDGLLRLDLLDVGQGEAILVRLPRGETILVDAGGLRSEAFDVGASVVAPALWALGVRRLDLVVATHAHRDHAGGLPAVVQLFPTDEVWIAPGDARALPALRRACSRSAVPLREVARDVQRKFGPASLEVLHPPPGSSGRSVNDRSLVLRIRLGGRCLLLTGDVGESVERLLLDDGIGPCDVLKVGHHGSRTATSRAFLAAIRPRLALVSAGEANPWGHPEPEVIDRLAAAGARVLRTDRQGMVTVVTDGRTLLWGCRLPPDQLRERRRDEADDQDDERQKPQDVTPDGGWS